MGKQQQENLIFKVQLETADVLLAKKSFVVIAWLSIAPKKQ